MAIEITASGKIKVPRGYGKAREMILEGAPVDQVAEATGKDPEILKEIAKAAKSLPKKEAKKPATKKAKASKKAIEPEDVDGDEDIDDVIDSI